MLLIAGINLATAQSLSSNNIKATWNFPGGTVAYSIVSADIPAGSSFAWTVDSKSVTDGISNSGQTITLPLTNKTRSGEVTITFADNSSQTVTFSIEPKAYGVDYDGNHFYADSYQLYPDGTEGDGSKEKPFLISNDMELARLAHEVNNGNAQQMFSQKHFKLTKDIDLSKGLWTPIGTSQGILNATEGHFFAGKFDGDGRSISNMLVCWTFNAAKEASFGLFSRLNGKSNNENDYASVTNLIIDNARIEKLEAHMPLNNANYTVKMGIVVADMTQNAELSNIIIRNSKISDNNESYTTKTKFRIGGIAGYLNNFVSLRIFNISADTEIDVFRNAALNGVEGQVTISCGFGAASKLANQTGYVVWPRNIYVHGAGLKTSANTTQCKKASVMAFIAADNFASKVKDTWYYTPANKAADTYAYNQYGVEKDISATDATTGEPFGKAFAGLNNLYINQNNLDKRPWLYSNSSKRFSFSSIALKAERGTSDVLTVTTEDGETTSDVYNWYASTDNTDGEQVNSTACNPFTLPRQTYSQYVYAMTVDGSQRTNTVLVEAIGITAELDYDTKPGTYIVNVKNDTKEHFTNDELGLDITYEWHNKKTLLSETSNEFVRPETATNKDQYNCTVTVKSGGNIIFHKNIKVTIVVYLCPEAVSINGTTYAQGEDNDDEEWGYSPTQAMKTWKGAYSKLSKTGTWDENIIVLMGTSHTDVTNSQYTGFNITSNNRGKSILKFDDWAKAKGESPLFRNATITGDWDGTDYKGTIEIYGAEKGLPIWGDTRFEYITFNNDPVTNNGGDFYKIIYCQYNNLEMGEGIQMTGFGQNSPDYGTIDGAVTTAFHIFGGFNNDGRFFPLSNKKSISDFEQSMPHGKEGFKISIKSGFYSAISAGGRQTSSEKDYNGVMGTPNLPIKCTIEMDIDRKWNDAHNPERGIKGETSKRKSDYDAGIILAGSHEGAMYADVDIIIRSGKVARVVNGSLGAQRDFILPYNDTDYHVPNNTYMGRANIMLDPASSKHNNDEWIDNRVIVTEMYGGSTGRGHTGNVIVNNPFYGYSTITINGGIFYCPVFGGGYGVADAKEMGTSNVETLSDMARLYGQSSVNIMGGTFYKNIYGGGDMAIVEFDGNATNVVIGDSADIRGSVFAGGNGRRLRPASQAFAAGDGFTQHPELVGLVAGNANVSFAGSTQQAPFIYGDIFGGGNLAQVANDTHVNIYAGNIAGEVFGGGNGDITDGTVTSADVLGNTNVTLAQDEGGTQSVGHGPIDDSFSINVIWFKMWDPVENIFYIWDPDIDDAGDEPATEDTVYEKSKFYADGKFLNPHNIYGGGNLACNVGTYKDADGNVTTTPADGTGLATVMMQKGMTPYELLITDEWKQSYTDNENPHFSVFGGGYGRLTTVGSTDVTVNVDGDYGKNGPGHDGNIDPNDPSLDNSMGEPNFTVWAVLGGGYAGTVAGNTKVTVDGKTFIRRVFGGGFGDIASTEDNTTGQIGGNTEVYMRGAFTHGDVFGGSAGLKPETASSTHFITVARVIGTTMVEVADNANIYGNVYGGGDNANVGIYQEMKPSDYYSPDLLTSASTLNQADGSFISYKAEGYRSFVNIRGGNIFGNVYGGGVGCKKAEANQYYNIGRINGNTLVHVVNSNPGVDSGIDNVVPCVWGDIYGGCEYGTVDGNTLVHIEGGMLGKNVYGGGYGDIDIDSELTADEEVLGKKDVAGTGTYANILGNTKVQMDGGSWIWNRKASPDGVITTWLDVEADSSPVCKDLEEFIHIAYAITAAPSLDSVDDPLAKEAVDRIMNNANTLEFFDHDKRTFGNKYNIFGGGNRACHVGTSSVAGTGKATVVINHSPLDDVKDTKGKTISMFDPTTVQGICWFLCGVYVANPSFSLFGAGYGANTSVVNTEIHAQPGTRLDDNGMMTINERRYRYLNQSKDYKNYVDFEKQIYADYLKLSPEEKKIYYGSYDGSDNDPNIFRRYHVSYLAWSLGEPGFVMLQVHGGGYSGYVNGNTYVDTDCQFSCHDIFGGGLGSMPYGDYTDGSGFDFGSVKGNAEVFVKSGNVGHNVFGGGAGVESVKKNGNLIDFPDMAHVESTKVHIYGKTIKYRAGVGNISRTLIMGNVYGGGDVANVGSTKADAEVFSRDNYINPTNRTTLVNIRGGYIMSSVFAGGKGRSVTACADNRKLGGVYGNTCLIFDRPVMKYPYWDETKNEYLSPDDPDNMTHYEGEDNKDFYTILMGRAYGGCQNGTVFGNTLMTVYDGRFAMSIYGGGFGSVETVTTNGSESVSVTSADVTGNTNMLILGGKMLVSSYWNAMTRTWYPASIVNGVIYSPQYDHNAKKFLVDHNFYAGGNVACIVGNNTYLSMAKGLIYKDIEMVAGRDAGKNFFASDEWREIYNKVGTPQFSMFGGGYGDNAIVMGDTYVNVVMEGRGSILEGIDIEEGKEHMHFYSGYCVMDIIGGGYSGKVVGDTHIVGSGGVFCRRVFGGGTYSSVNSTDVELKAIDCHDIFGGGFMGDVLKSTTVKIGYEKTPTTSTYSNADIFIHGNVYGGNDVSGYVNVGLNKDGYFMDNGGTGTSINIYGGHLFGDVYGAGNGNYLYATDRNGNKKVTVNEYYPVNPNDPDSETVPLVYTVPMRENMTQLRSTSDAVKMVNINSWRPLTNKVNINIKGVSKSDTIRIDGNVYGGGNSATVQKMLAYGASEEANTNTYVGDINVNIGSHVRIGGVFMGCNGEELFVTSEDNDYMNMFQKLNGDEFDHTQELNLADSIDWVNDPENANISTVYLPTENSKRPIVYPHLLDLYFQPVETDIQGSLKWNGSETGEGLTDCIIGTFCCGGNRGNMNVLPKTSGKIGNVLEYTFPEGLTITDKIVGGCNNTNYDYKGKASHRGGYLLGDADSEYPFIKLNIRNKFMPKEKNGAYVGGNVYGGCFKSGTIVGDVHINLQSDMLAGKDKDKLEKSNELLVKAAEYSALNVYGAGYGMESYIYGIADVTIGESVKCSEPKMDGNKFLPCGVVDADSNPEGLGVSANFVYGGGQQGNVVGYSTIKMLNGHIFRAVTGGSYSGYVYGSTQVIVGYPTYYSTNPQNHARGIYELKRTDRKNLGLENDNGKEKTPAIKQYIYLLDDEWISQGVYEDIVAIDNGNGMRDTITDANRAHYFKKIVPAAPSVGWENVNITIEEAVYGGGYSVAQGSIFANNTTVLKLTDKYNLDYDIINGGNGDDLNKLPGGSTAGFCGNTLVLVGDNKDSEHITISHQDIRPVQLPDGTDLYGYYYKHYASDADAANGIYTYRYISLQDKYFFKSGATPPSGLEGIRENEFYEYDSEGGIFGDGHLSYAQGFRSADLTGYGFAGHTIDNPKILNTFQRLDIIRLEDNCFSLLGARDYTVNDVNKTPYSIARVGEIKMVANDIRFDSNGNLEAKPDNNTDFRYSTKARNYMGFSNNILYVSAITSNVDFNSGMWRNRHGQLAAASTDNTAFAGMSYQGVKQHYIDDYNANKDKEDAEDPFGEFQKRNDGTAMNMIGIASGYAMKIQLCHETYDAERKKVVENKLYGPIYGVVEMNLINVREDEGGGYVYADNNHKRHDGDTHEEDFLETTGNFVFPYHKGRYIVDDCFPTGYHAITAPDSDKTVDDVKVHYWYVTGFHYYYNVNISGYTFKSSKENPLEFDSDNKDGLTVLAGLKSTQPVRIFNWKMRSGHPDDKSQYSSDLEYRNYLTGTETNETDKTYYSDAVAGGYKLYVGGAESNNFSGATTNDDPDKASKGFAALLSMREKGDDEATLFNNSLPAGLKEDAKISFRLVDMVDNTNYVEPDYFDKHLGRKSMATLVLKAPAYEEYVSETDNKPIYTNTGKFYKKTETGYELVESGSLDADNTYYQPQTEEFVKIDNLFTYNTVNKKYEKVENISDVIIDESNPTVYYVQREYTYTIYLTIEYVQGPTVSGQITIGNCALPGEMVRVTKDNIVVSADQSFAVNGYYWRIGKRQKDADGKWVFKDTTPWTKENISNNVATGYDTFSQADEKGKGLFAGCHYDKTDDLLDIPVYYYMNGYGIQLGVSITGLNDIMEVGMLDADKFVVHNYHRMDPHKAGINLHLAEAITRVNEESLDASESDPLPEPRIYISDKTDLSAFVAFVDSIGTDSNAPRYGAKAQFFLQNNIALEATDKGGYYISDFAGILHGDGHVISGVPSGKSLFNSIASSGNIYNLGLASGKISNLDASGKIGNYHCCFEYAPAADKSGSTPVVYRWDGSPDKGYTTEDFRLGRVAYDLNEYYLRARHRDAATTTGTEADADNEILKYVSAYYANGDYQYACRTDAITGNNTGITYLRIGKGGDVPNYEQVDTRHDKTHPLDAPRVKYNADGSVPTPVVYTPLFNANNSGAEPMNDFLFWGQSLQHDPENYPGVIASHQNSYMSNRVYRTAAYYGDTSLDAFHYNAYSSGSITMSTYVHNPATTAVDFTCLHDLPAATETVGGIFYPPMDDNASRFNDFVVKEDAGITQNLLVYTADNDEATGNEAYDVVEKALNYNETTREALISGHHITKGIDGYSTSLLHLVERTPDNENGDGETCNNNNLCVPIAFNVNDRAWYVRRPMYYAKDSKGAWEGICLPFTVDKVAASLNGEITHFYGSPSDAETDNPSQNIHSLHHEYWLRGLTSIATEGNVPSAVFQRPGAALFSPTDASGNALTNGVSYTFANTFFVDNYADKLYNQYANPYYATAHNYPDYLRLAGEVPYIVRFPGARYYEFDLSSAFYNDIFGAWEDAQTVTFNAYGDNHTGDTSYGAITIPITKGMATMVGGKYSHLGTFSAINVSNGNVYGMNDSGTAFDDASSLSTVTPFRTYMSPTATRSNARYDYTSVINIAEQNADNIMPDMEENEDDTQKEDHITVRAIGNQRVRIESTMATRLNVVTVAGQLYRILDVQPGIATYSDFQPGLYIFGTTKVIVR